MEVADIFSPSWSRVVRSQPGRIGLGPILRRVSAIKACRTKQLQWPRPRAARM